MTFLAIISPQTTMVVNALHEDASTLGYMNLKYVLKITFRNLRTYSLSKSEDRKMSTYS